MAEIYGEREGTRRMTNMVLQSLANWGAITRSERGKVIVRRTPVKILESSVVAWLVEACLRYTGCSLTVTNIESSPLIFPFDLGGSTAYLISRSSALEILVDSGSNQIVGLVR